MTAFALDSRLTARIAVTGERLLEMLNEAGAVHLRDVTLQALEDGHQLTMAQLDVERDELLDISMVGPRGNEARRRATRAVPTALRVGPYRIWGLVHSVLSADAMSPLHGHRPMIPLTEVTILYQVAAADRREQVPGLIVNRENIEHVNEAITESDLVAIDLDRDYGILGRVAEPRSTLDLEPTTVPDAHTSDSPEGAAEPRERLT